MPIGPADDSRASTRAAPGVDRQRHEKRDLREDPDDVEEALVRLGARDEVPPEDRVDVDRTDGEVVRDGGAEREGSAPVRRAPARDEAS